MRRVIVISKSLYLWQVYVLYENSQLQWILNISLMRVAAMT